MGRTYRGLDKNKREKYKNSRKERQKKYSGKREEDIDNYKKYNKNNNEQ